MEDYCLFEIPLFLRLSYYSKSLRNLWQEYRIVNDYAIYNLSNSKIDRSSRFIFFCLANMYKLLGNFKNINTGWGKSKYSQTFKSAFKNYWTWKFGYTDFRPTLYWVQHPVLSTGNQ